MIIDVAIFTVGLAAILWSGGFLVRALARVASFLEVSEFLVSFVLVAIATSLPELSVVVTAGLANTPQLSFGDIMGSNIVNLTVMFAIPAFLVRGLPISGLKRRDLLYLLFLVALPMLMLLDGTLSRIDGAILLGTFGLYMVHLFRQKEYFGHPLRDSMSRDWDSLKGFFRDGAIVIVGFVVLLVGARLLVNSATGIAADIGIPVALIGVLVVGFGTNIPELVFGSQAVLHGHGGMVAGGILGSVISNTGLGLGLLAMLSPVHASTVPAFMMEGIFLLVAVVVLGVAMRTGRRLSVFEGVMLMTLYVVFVIAEVQMFLS